MDERVEFFSLTPQEQHTRRWYDRNAIFWAESRKKLSEPSFWQLEYEELLRLRPLKGRILEVGSGSGREAIEWVRNGYEYFGIDTALNLLGIAQKSEPSGQYFLASPYNMPFDSNSFDLMTSWAMLPHVPKSRIAEALNSLHRVLKSDGIAFFAMREGEGEVQESAGGRWFSYYTQNEFDQLLKDAGFLVINRGKKLSRENLTWLTFFARVSRHQSGMFSQ